MKNSIVASILLVGLAICVCILKPWETATIPPPSKPEGTARSPVIVETGPKTTTPVEAGLKKTTPVETGPKTTAPQVALRKFKCTTCEGTGSGGEPCKVCGHLAADWGLGRGPKCIEAVHQYRYLGPRCKVCGGWGTVQVP